MFYLPFITNKTGHLVLKSGCVSKAVLYVYIAAKVKECYFWFFPKIFPLILIYHYPVYIAS